MSGLPILRRLLAVQDRAEAHGTAQGFPPLELRFALEYSAPPDFAAERSANAQLLESEEFTLQPLFAGDEPELAPIPLLRFPGIERMLWPETLFSIAYDLADARALVRAEPDLGSLIFADPPPLTDELRPEAADALGALCWVDADTPADKRWALETIGVLRAWARYPSRERAGFARKGMLEAMRVVRAPLANLLNDEQKTRFNAVPSGEDQNEPERRRNLSVLCSERAWGFLVYQFRRMELAVRPDEVQRASLRALQDSVAQAGELLKTDCPTYRPITPVVRIDAMEQRLDAMLRAINIVQPALEKFYGSLTDEQKERFNRLAPVQG
jgi:hypothetical protein